MKRVRIFLIALLVFIITTIVGVNMLLNGKSVLKNFDIISVSNDYTKYIVEYERVPAAIKYKIEIIDENNVKVFENETTKTKETIELTNLEYKKDYSLMVYAYDSVGDSRPANEEYIFTWDEPNFSEDLNIILNNKDYKVIVNGDISKNKYYLEIKNDQEVLEKILLKSSEYIINSKYYKDKKMKLNISILCDDSIIDTITLYNNMNPITNLKITSPKEDSIVPLDDISLIYEGGDNALSYEILILEDNNLIKKSETTKKHVIISKKLFDISKKYTLKVIGKYQDFKKEAVVNFTMSDKEKLSPVYISNNSRQIRKGTLLELKCNDKDAKIYYTLNGKNPESFGILYEKPIKIDKNVILKTVAVNEKKYNSIISTHEINVSKKEKLKVYISPSNQYANLGVSEVGYTNERDEMNDLSNYIEERLESYGVKVYRNNSSGNINLWLRDSNYLGVDLHLAVHSNASVDHKSYGVETWIHNESSQTYSLANLIQDNLISIYPNKDLKDYDRGVKYANGALGEVNDNYLPFGILLEIAHHDYKNDAEWMINNKKLIGYNIADSILEYYQIIE